MANRQIRTDLFPASVTLTSDDGTTKIIDKARVILTLDHMYVFTDAARQPHIAFEDRLVSYTPPAQATRVRKAHQLLDRSAHFETADGFTGSFIRMGSCGCGSRLKTASLASLFPEDSATVVSTKDIPQEQS